jgi:hypothetical protein
VYNQAYTVVSGHRWFQDGVIRFPELTDRTEHRTQGIDGTYRTRFGPCVAHTGIVYGKSNSNQRKAMRRMTAARGTLAQELAYQCAQTAFVHDSEPFLQVIQTMYSQHMGGYTNAIQEAEWHHADEHPKKQLRIHAWQEMVTGHWEGIGLGSRLWLKNPLYKLKLDEIAKPGKVPRMIADLGVPASLQGAWLVERMKKVMAAHPVRYRGCVIEFCDKPEPTRLARVFRRLLSTKTRHYVYFSDDACLGVATPAGVVIYNLDIKSCDSSHTTAIFQALVRVTPPALQHEMQVLVDQCALPIRVRDVDFPESKRRVILRPTGPRLLSGSTVTTFINNTANLLIAKSIIDQNAVTVGEITQAASRAGYLVTLEPCEIPQDIQFLKHSPVIDTTGRLRAMLNVGVMLRSIGTCKGDLPGRGPFEPRARRFTGAFLRGMYPRVQFPLLQMLWLQASEPDTLSTRRVQNEFVDGRVVDEGECFSVSSVEVYRRYRLSETEQAILDSEFGRAGFEEHYAGIAASKILSKDYGLSCQPNPLWD